VVDGDTVNVAFDDGQTEPRCSPIPRRIHRTIGTAASALQGAHLERGPCGTIQCHVLAGTENPVHRRHVTREPPSQIEDARGEVDRIQSVDEECEASGELTSPQPMSSTTRGVLHEVRQQGSDRRGIRRPRRIGRDQARDP
jgi:hypothetical protein